MTEARPGDVERGSQPVLTMRRRLGDVLVERGTLTKDQLAEALVAQRAATGPRRRLGTVLVQLGTLTERQLAEALADLLGLATVDLNVVVVDASLGRLLPRALAERARVLPVARVEGGLRVATSDPTDVVAMDDVRLHTSVRTLELVVATESQLLDHITRAWSLRGDGSEVTSVLGELAPEAEVAEPVAIPATEDAPTVRLVAMILTDAVRSGASDVHVEPTVDGLRIRYRIDGVLRDVTTIPRSAAPSVLSRLKILSGLDIGERRVPQDGRTRIVVDGEASDARVSSLPSLHGEKIVVRVMPRAEHVRPLEQLGMAPEQLAALGAALADPQGLVLITGPTGSGKTNTLYAALARVTTPEVNTVTLEDPVEIEMPGITQVQVNERTGMTFGRGLRAVLRQDPDVVLVGEIRDAETAELALRAALTGHLVLSTLHTNSAAASAGRLVDMGAEPFLVASSLTCAVAQRLARRPCPACRAPYRPDAEALRQLGLSPADLDGAAPVKGTGCRECSGSGYRGRVGVFEVLPVTDAVRAVLAGAPDEAALVRVARDAGLRTLRESAVDLARRGQTTFEEAVRVTPRGR